MLFLTLFSLLVCPKTLMLNESKEAFWTKHDLVIKQNAEKRCPQIYGKRYKCLKTFIKRAPKTYWAICGEPNVKRY